MTAWLIPRGRNMRRCLPISIKRDESEFSLRSTLLYRHLDNMRIK